jgi:hypothetical protein
MALGAAGFVLMLRLRLSFRLFKKALKNSIYTMG